MYMLICLGALRYIIFVFGFPGLCTLRQYMRDKGMANMYMTVDEGFSFCLVTLFYPRLS